MRGTLTGLAIAMALTAPAQAAVSYLKCEMQTVYHRPAPHNTEITHVENQYTKYFRVDSDAKMVALFNDRNGKYSPICSAKNSACKSDWSGGAIALDGRGAPDDPVPPYLDFRRAFKLGKDGKTAQLIIADYGQNTTATANMYWSYDGSCSSTAEPKRRQMGPPPGVKNPNYEKPTAPALPISKAEQDQLMASYYGNTMWGYSGGGHWFRMWFLGTDGLAYTSDDEDMTSEGAPRQWYFGKDSTGYRICGQPIPPEGREGCYPHLIRKLGDSWVQHDMDGDAHFRLDAGRL